MIDPENITNYDQTDVQLEEFILFWVCAAGKNGRTAARCLEKFLSVIVYNNMSPFQAIRNKCSDDNMPADILDEVPDYITMPELMRLCGIGCYKSKSRSFVELVYSKLDLKTCSVENLETIHGIGMKTARCFLIHSRKGVKLAGIDTHMLKHLRVVGVENVPSSTPGSKKEYLRLEQEFLRLSADADKEPAVFDLEIWNKYSVKSTSVVKQRGL